LLKYFDSERLLIYGSINYPGGRKEGEKGCSLLQPVTSPDRIGDVNASQQHLVRRAAGALSGRRKLRTSDFQRGAKTSSFRWRSTGIGAWDAPPGGLHAATPQVSSHPMEIERWRMRRI